MQINTDLRVATQHLFREYHDILSGVGCKEGKILAMITDRKDLRAIPKTYKGFQVIKEITGDLKMLAWK